MTPRAMPYSSNTRIDPGQHLAVVSTPDSDQLRCLSHIESQGNGHREASFKDDYPSLGADAVACQPCTTALTISLTPIPLVT